MMKNNYLCVLTVSLFLAKLTSSASIGNVEIPDSGGNGDSAGDAETTTTTIAPETTMATTKDSTTTNTTMSEPDAANIQLDSCSSYPGLPYCDAATVMDMGTNVYSMVADYALQIISIAYAKMEDVV